MPHVKLQQNAAPQDHDTCFARACAIEMHMDMSPEPVYKEISMENAGRPRYHLE